MQLIAYSVGTDISAETFDACLEEVYDNRSTKVKASRKFKNTLAGFKCFTGWLKRKAEHKDLVHVAMEATGRYHESLAYFLFEAKYRISIVLPNKIKSFAHSLNEYSKNDPLDAKIIAAYTSKHVPGSWCPISASMRDLRELSRERESLTQMRTRTKNRLTALKSGHKALKETVKRLGKQVVFYDKQIVQVESEMAQITMDDEALSNNFKLLVSVPYVGAITAYTIMAETDCFNLFENRNQLIKYAGLDIIDKQSGTSVRGKGKISKRGNSRLRSAPYPGLNAISRGSGVFVETFRAAISRGMEPKQARTAVVRQVLRVAFAVLKSGQSYAESVHRNRASKKIGELESSPTVTHLAS